MAVDPRTAPPPEIPGYDIVRELGAGGMARVYLAVQRSLHREVALKVMIPGMAVDEISCHRFLKEGRIAAQLNHQNLLTVYDIGVHDEQYYMASEYLPGGTVRDRLEHGQGLDDQQIVKIVSDVAQGLLYAHSKGFVHRDVKPGNLLFRANGECVLGDFGIAKSVDSTTNATQLGTSIGTPHYMSPEQAKGEKVDHRTDLYSLGVVFYELLAGEPPFDADDPFTVALAQINQPVPKLGGDRARFQPVIENLMAKGREERFESAEAFLDDLEALTGHVSPTRRTTRKKIDVGPIAAGSGPPGRLGRLARLAGVVVLVAMVAYGGWVLYQGLSGGGPADPGGALDDREGRVAALIEEASRSIEAGRFFTPNGQAAIDRLEEALRLDPTSAEARSRLSALPGTAAAYAEARWNEGETEEARRIISEGLTRYPSNTRLRDLLARAEGVATDDESAASGAASADASAVQGTLRRAGRFFEVGELAQATRLYQQVIVSDPGNATAQAQLDRIAASWADLAESFLQQGQLEQAANMIRQGLQARPDDPRLAELRARIEAAEGP